MWGFLNIDAPEFNVYPNPFKSSIYIEGDTQDITSLRLSDAVGKVIWELPHFTSNPISLPNKLESGLYILSINTSESNYYSTKVYKH